MNITHINELDLNLLKSLYYLLQEQNVSRAAERMGVSQSAMSRTLARLREAFDDALFTRAAHGLLPTTRALHLLEPLEAILSRVDALMKPPVYQPAMESGWFRIQTPDFPAVVYLPSRLVRIQALAPGLYVELRSLDKAVFENVESGQVDLAIGLFPDAPERMLSRKLFEDRFVCLMRAGHPGTKAGGFSLAEYCQCDHILVSMRGRAKSGIDFALEKEGLDRRIGLRVQTFFPIPRILAYSDMIATMPALMAEYMARLHGLSICELPLPYPSLKIYMLWHERVHADARHRWMREQLSSQSPQEQD